MGIVFYCCAGIRRLDFYKNNKQFSLRDVSS